MMKKALFPLVVLLSCCHVSGAQQKFETVETFKAPEAHQAVAVDSNYFYAISSTAIGKYDKDTGEKVDYWPSSDSTDLVHLDSGVIRNGKLYAAHSNYPSIPMTSSVEIWNSRTMKHIGSHSFGIRRGSLTWIDRYKGYWWGVFAHYDEFEKETGKDNRWTTLVKFNDNWQEMESWVFPGNLLDKFGTKSNSGGSWGADGRLYLSGHDRAELYIVELPNAGSVIQHVKTVPIENEGQGIAWDRSEENIIYTIKRSSLRVVVSRKMRN